MRIRIALTTALAVALLASTLFTIFASSPAASARTSHVAAAGTQPFTGNIKLMSYARAEKIAELVTYYDGVVAHEQAVYLTALEAQKQAALRAQQLQQQQEAAQAAQAAQAAAAANAAASSSADATSTDTPDWACIRFHESRDNYTDGNGGAYQFEFGTWHAVTGLPDPAEDYPPSVQDAAALRLYAERGWRPWSTRYVCGL